MIMHMHDWHDNTDRHTILMSHTYIYKNIYTYIYEEDTYIWKNTSMYICNYDNGSRYIHNLSKGLKKN